MLILIEHGIPYQEADVNVATVNIQLSSVLLTSRNARLAVSCVYRSPSTCEQGDVFLRGKLDRLFTMAPQVVIMGDFNLPEIQWAHQTCPTTGVSGCFLDWFDSHALHQHVEQYTRFRGSQTPSVLDLVLSTSEHGIFNMHYLPPIGKSDHAVITFQVTLRYRKPPVKCYRRFGNLDWQAVRHAAAQYSWRAEESSLESSWILLKQNILSLQERFAPLVPSRKKGKPPWWRASIRRSIQKRDRLWRAYNFSFSHSSWVNYKVARNASVRIQRSMKRKFERKLATQVKACPKRYYSYVQSKGATRNSMATLVQQHGSAVNSNKIKAKLFL